MDPTAAIVTLLLGLLDRAAAVGALLTKTRAEGRQPTAEELDALVADDKAKSDEVNAEIARQRAAAQP